MFNNFKKTALYVVFIERSFFFEGFDLFGFFIFPVWLYTTLILIVFAFLFTLIEWILSWFGGVLYKT